MSCADGAPDDGFTPDATTVGDLFAQLDGPPADLARLHPVELDILKALRIRPLRTWCRTQFRLLEGLVLKAQGQPLDKVLARR